MPADFFAIPTPVNGQLAVVARPRGGDWLATDVGRWKSAGVDTVVSLLMPDETATLDLDGEAASVSEAGMQFLSVPIPDRGIPLDTATYNAAVTDLAEQLRAGRTVAIHCRMSVGRAPMLAANVLIRLGVKAGEAIDAVSTARGVRIPETDEQKRWIANNAAEIVLTAA